MPAQLPRTHNSWPWRALTNRRPSREGRTRMPLLRYFGVVGPALLMLLLGVSWILPDSVVEPTHAGIERPAIRISSIEKLPERWSSIPRFLPLHFRQGRSRLRYSLLNRHSHSHR